MLIFRRYATGCERVFAVSSVLIGLALLSAAAAPARANDGVSRYIIEKGCFLRHYSSAHLKSHPRQRVKRIAVSVHAVLSGEAAIQSNATLILDVFVRLKGYKGWLPSGAGCKDGGPGELRCPVEVDGGGSFKITLRPDGRIVLRSATGGFAVEGPNGPFMIADEKSDDRIFYLPPAPPAICKKVNASMNEE